MIYIYIYIYIYKNKFDTRYQTDHISAQPIQLGFKFAVAETNVSCHVLVLTRRISNVSSAGN